MLARLPRPSGPFAPRLATFAAVAGSTLFVFLQLDPGFSLWPLHGGLLFQNTLETGGDTGAHVAHAAFLRYQLLPHFHLTGWDPEWYDGFPLYSFYFPAPDAIAALLSFVIPWNVAFKLGTVLGSLTLPSAAWAFGRLAGLERPRPALLACFSLPFLFGQSYTIDGGNIYSTMAGEYAFSLGLSVSLVFLGLVARGLRTGRYRASAAIVLAVCFLSHLVTVMFALAGAVVLFVLLVPTWRRVWWMTSALGTGCLLASFWLVPFAMFQAYTTSMGYTNQHNFDHLFLWGTGYFHGNRWALWLAGFGLAVAIYERRREVVMFGILGASALVATMIIPQGKLYNVRLVPLWWLCVYMLAGSMVGEALVGAAWLCRRGRELWWWWSIPTAADPGGGLWSSTPGGSARRLGINPMAVALSASDGGLGSASSQVQYAGTVAVTAETGVPDPTPSAGGSDGARGPEPGRVGVFRSSPGHPWAQRPQFAPWAPGAVYGAIIGLALALVVVAAPLFPYWFDGSGWIKVAPSSVRGWVEWNMSGYQAKPAWGELEAVMTMLREAGKEDGCGRVFWEYSPDLNRFGTTMAPMIIPMLAGSCMNTQEGVLFESAGTTPYHFIDQSELSAVCSCPEVGLGPYYGINVPLGIKHLQLLGVKYFLASSSYIEAQAARDPSLKLIATSGPWQSLCDSCTSVGMVDTTWKLYLVAGSEMVESLSRQPVVLSGEGQSQPSWLLPLAAPWYNDPSRWSTELVTGGPPGWARTTVAKAPQVVGASEPEVNVTSVKVGTSSISFHVDRTGVPVLVKISYFPAWHAIGAEGPWRATPNLMVVVPTSHDVKLTYGSTGPGMTGEAMSFAGLVGLLVLVRNRHRLYVT